MPSGVADERDPRAFLIWLPRDVTAPLVEGHRVAVAGCKPERKAYE